MLAPVVVVVPASFSASKYPEFPPRDYSFRWYDEFFSSELWQASLKRSVLVACMASVVATLLGLGVAEYLRRASGRSARSVRGLVTVPLIMPVIVLALGLYDLYSRLHLLGSSLGLAVAHAMLGLPFATLILSAAFSRFDSTLEKAAWTLGASRLRTYVTVTLPLIRPALLASLISCFVVSFDEVVLSLFLVGSTTQTLPVRMFSFLKTEVTPVLGAISTLLIATFVVGWLLVLLLQRVLRSRRRPSVGRGA